MGMSCSGPAYPHLPRGAALYSQSFEQPHVNVTQGDKSQLVSPLKTIPADASGLIQRVEDLMEQNSRVTVPRRAKPSGASAPGSCRASAAASTPPRQMWLQRLSILPRTAWQENRPGRTNAGCFTGLLPTLCPGFKGSQPISGAVFLGSSLGMNSER